MTTYKKGDYVLFDEVPLTGKIVAIKGNYVKVKISDDSFGYWPIGRIKMAYVADTALAREIHKDNIKKIDDGKIWLKTTY